MEEGREREREKKKERERERERESRDTNVITGYKCIVNSAGKKKKKKEQAHDKVVKQEVIIPFSKARRHIPRQGKA